MNRLLPDEIYRWVVLGIVIMGTFMAILVSSSVNVALPYMMSAFEVDRNKIEWVITAFMLASAVAMPLVGWLVGRLGYKVLYLSSLSLFTIGSICAAFAWSYDSLIVSRVIQAIGSGAIMPIGMAYVAELFEPHERGKALGVWGTGIMLGPALGPTLGGYLTDYFSWRAIFSVNVPFGILTFAAGFLLMKSDWKTIRKRIPFDFWGYVFLSLAVITGLLALSQGQEKGWDSTYIYTCMACVVIGITMFISIETASRNPLLDLSLFRSTNYSVSMVLAVFRAVGLFGGIFLLPIFLENLVGYTTIQTGLWMMPGAVALAICMPLSGKLADRYSPRWLVLFGTAITGMSMLMYGYLDPLSGAGMIIGPQIIRGAGLAFMMAPLLTAAINSIPKAQTAVASGFLNIAQQIGGSFGIAILNTYVTSSIQTHAVRIGEMIGTSTPEFSRLVHYSAYSALRQPHGQMFSGQSNTLLVSPFSSIMNHASVMGFNNGFVLGGLIVLAGIPLCLLLKPSEHHNKRHLRT